MFAVVLASRTRKLGEAVKGIRRPSAGRVKSASSPSGPECCSEPFSSHTSYQDESDLRCTIAKRPRSRDVRKNMSRPPVTERAGASGGISQTARLEPWSGPETISRSLEGEKHKFGTPGE